MCICSLCVQVVVSVVSEKCRIDTELLPSLFLRCTTDPLRREKYPAVTHLKFLTRENSEQVTSTTSNISWVLFQVLFFFSDKS